MQGHMAAVTALELGVLLPWFQAWASAAVDRARALEWRAVASGWWTGW